MIIKVDVDGVIRNMNESMCSLYNKTYGEHLTVDDIFDYDVEKVFTKIREVDNMSACDFFFKKHAREMFLESKPYEGVRNALQSLIDHGHKVVIVTWQFTPQNKLFTLKFFERNHIPYDDICFTKDKWMIHGDWLIDDNPEFLLDKRDKSNKIMINMPYNKFVVSDDVRMDSLENAVWWLIEYDEKCHDEIFDLSKMPIAVLEAGYLSYEDNIKKSE